MDTNDITLDRYKALSDRLTVARERTFTLRTELEAATAEEQALAAEVACTETVIARALSLYKRTTDLDIEDLLGLKDGKSPEPADASKVAESRDSEEDSTPEPPGGIRPSFYQMLLLIPIDGHVTKDALRAGLNISNGALTTRIAKAKQAGLIETAGWGEYRLTQKAKDLMAPRLRVVHP